MKGWIYGVALYANVPFNGDFEAHSSWIGETIDGDDYSAETGLFWNNFGDFSFGIF